MEKVKKISALLLAVSLSISMAACNGSSTQSKAPESSASPASSAVKADDTKVKVGVSWAADKVDEYIQMYADAVTKAGGEPVFLPQIKTEAEAKEALSEVSALVMTGGEDIDPQLYYNEKPDPKLETVNAARDTSDSLLLKAAIAADMPTLCTCRGMQFLNVVCGGTLYQDFPSMHKSDVQVIHRDPKGEVFVKHQVNVDANNLIADAFGGKGEYTVNSWHHQSVKDLGKNLKIVAKAPDGIVEGIVKEDNTYIVGVQFHPEAMVAEGNNSFLEFYKDLIDQGEKETVKKAA
ncbi:gamma-glutamyl-gamma-aminobutyrate hydrolase family protein [Faecalispora anaeroviscerum]|uniref:gamma-glutamyl-gamma-aminobutyrate hydrolase family protein n=1 Tax=Faecalispora anaeroviscerum TaxID=2991836 RepID=UPI0024B9FA50|nr:gamma-glutamyl-gamma-aminobutyrate hydrolase family protein [Faecalispora anaeroviscerum]